MKIATFNVNGVNGRLPALLRWLAESKPDVACLQELKAPQEKFPEATLREAGYGAVWHGQKSWNGVAILARGLKPVESRRGLPGDLLSPANHSDEIRGLKAHRNADVRVSELSLLCRTQIDDTHSRYIEALIDDVLVGCLYLPNGNPALAPKFDYKLRWFERLMKHAEALLATAGAIVLASDYTEIALIYLLALLRFNATRLESRRSHANRRSRAEACELKRESP